MAMTGLSYPAVRATIDLFAAGDWLAIRPANRGRNKGEGRSLSEVQEAVIRRTIIDNHPEPLKMDFCLWSRTAVGQLIEQEYDIKLHVRSVGKYLKRWEFTPQKPIKRAYEQSPEAVQAWLEGEYPAIGQRAKREGAEIHWGTVVGVTEIIVSSAVITVANTVVGIFFVMTIIVKAVEKVAMKDMVKIAVKAVIISPYVI